jgi:hypothetical protein
MIHLFIALAAMILTSPAFARPVSYVGGWTLIEETDRQATSVWAHYTVTPKLSVGVRSEWDRKMEFQLHAVQATYLVRRWYGENYQANIYGFAGTGVADGVSSNPADAKVAGFVGVLADWETRRLFASYRARHTEAGAVGSAFFQAARVGFAPYEGDTGDLHTWLMVEVDYRPKNGDKIGLTPLVRFFKGAALFEAGWSLTDNEPLVNVTYRF